MPYKDKRRERKSKHDRYEDLKKDPAFVEARKKYRDENAQRNRDYQDIYRLTHAQELGELRERRKHLWRSSQKEYMREYGKQCVAKNREAVIRMYGGKCACCGESHHEFLQVDHVNGDGATHRKSCGSGSPFYRWLLRNSCPQEDLRLLCANCNWSRGKWGYCPHELQKSHPESNLGSDGGEVTSSPI